MSLVLDPSVTLGWYFEDERSPALDALLDRVVEGGAVVPVLWRLEVANGLRTALRRKRIDAPFRDAAMTQLACLPIAIDPDMNTHAWEATLRLSDRFALTMYDAAYLELSVRRAFPLASLDGDLRRAAQSLGVILMGAATDGI